MNTAIIGTGPAGLMAAWVLAKAGFSVTVFEKRRGPARKLLIAGSSGLNISNDLPFAEFCRSYGGNPAHFSKLFTDFPQKAWFEFINTLGISTFLGAGHRYFIRGMKASPLVRAWLQALSEMGVTLKYGHECIDFEVAGEKTEGVQLRFANGQTHGFDAVCFALGGGSYPDGKITFPEMFERKGLKFTPFRASNVGFEVDWPPKFLAEAEGLPLKTLVMTSSAGSKSGELIITQYGLEGTPVYRVGEVGTVHLDLKPGLEAAELKRLVHASRENLAPIRRVKKYLKLSPGSLALVFHCTPDEILRNLDALLARIKHFPVTLKARRPLAEAISSAGGLSFDELDGALMLRRFPGVFAAGEMLDWDAPTGGFLIQGCAAQGFLAGHGMVEYLERSRKI